MTASFWLRCGAALMFLAVAAGAFGAHALKTVLKEDMKAVYDTAVRYHAWHALALLAVAFISRDYPGRWVSASGWCFLAGVSIFSGSLYALSLTGLRLLGAITPIGGLLFLAGWLCLLKAPYPGKP